MADKRVSVSVEGRYVVTSDGIEETQRKAQALNATQEELAESATDAGDAMREGMEDAAAAANAAANAMNQTAEAAREAARASSRAGQDDTGAGALSRAQRMTDAIAANLAGGLSTLGQQSEQERRLQGARYYLSQAEAAGGDDPRVEALSEHLDRLAEALDANRAALEEQVATQEQERAERRAQEQAERDARAEARELARQEREAQKQAAREERERAKLERAAGRAGEAPDDEHPVVGALMEELRRMSGGGLAGMGGLGRLAGRLAIPGLIIGGVAATITGTRRMLEGANREAREEILALTDLARQYDFSLDPLGMFRQTGFQAQDWLKDAGYTTRDAARVGSLYDLPGGFQGDTRAILETARSSALDEEALTGIFRSLGLMGTFERGFGQDAARVLKHAMTEGVRDGVGQSDTLKGLVSVLEAGFQARQEVSHGALAFNASLQQVLAGTGNRALQGASGAQAQQDYLGAIAGGGDQAMHIALFSELGGVAPTAAELGFAPGSQEAAGYRMVAERSPMQAFLSYAIPRIRAGNATPELLEKFERAVYNLAGGDPVLLSWYFEQVGLNGDAALVALAGDMTWVSDAAARTPEFAAGTDPRSSSQGGNLLDASVRGLEVYEQQLELDRSFATFLATGDLETFLRDFMNVRKVIIRDVANWYAGGAGNFGLGGDLRGLQGMTAEDLERLNLDPATRQALDTAATYGSIGADDDPARLLGDVMYHLSAGAGARITTMPGDEATPEMLALGASPEHRGLDFAIGDPGAGDAISNPFQEATVIGKGFDPEGFGHWVTLADQNNVAWRLAHFAEEVEHELGSVLGFGQYLGMEGASGMATGAHLHMQLMDPNDPRNFDPDALIRLLLEGHQSPTMRDAGVSAPQEVNVHVTGLDNITVTGVSGQQASTIREGIATVVRGAVPSSWAGA